MIDWKQLALNHGYAIGDQGDIRLYIAINYFYTGESIQWMAEDLQVSRAQMAEKMMQENYPRRGKGQPSRSGFFCEECCYLTPLDKMSYVRREKGKVKGVGDNETVDDFEVLKVCRKCKRKMSIERDYPS